MVACLAQKFRLLAALGLVSACSTIPQTGAPTDCDPLPGAEEIAEDLAPGDPASQSGRMVGQTPQGRP
jgi:hypothetical protein